MGKLIDIAAASDLADGALKGVTADDLELLLARVGDEFYAADDRCPHMGARLSDGVLEGTVVVCPRHGSRFDLRDGHVERWTDFSGLVLGVAKALRAPRPLRTYAVLVRDGRLFVDIETES